MKISKGYYVIITKTEEEYKFYIEDVKIPLGMKFDKEEIY